MSTRKQQSNSRVMSQKIDKACRLLEEVKSSIEIRGVSHELWDATKVSIEEALRACSNAFESLDAISAHNKIMEAQKI